MSATCTLIVALLAVHLAAVTGEFTPHFRSFLQREYGQTHCDNLERQDMGRLHVGSFGGKLTDDEPVKNHPVIFVHGVTLRGGFFVPHRQFFMEHGYSSGELYATTYADGGQTSMFSMSMRCEDVKIVRNLIEAVYAYTNNTKVDVIAYSMGTAITRKAILGGHCVDTREDLGAPLTKMVDTYLCVGGVAYGLEGCPEEFNNCNPTNGMVCSSQYLRDVNSKPTRYEGQYTYSLYSLDDRIIGTHCCGHRCGELRHATRNIVRRGFNHGTIIRDTMDLQLALIRDHNTEPLKDPQVAHNVVEVY